MISNSDSVVLEITGGKSFHSAKSEQNLSGGNPASFFEHRQFGVECM